MLRLGAALATVSLSTKQSGKRDQTAESSFKCNEQRELRLARGQEPHDQTSMVACNTCHAGSDLVAAPATAQGATIRDRGGMFSREAVEKAEALLDQGSAFERRPGRDRDHRVRSPNSSKSAPSEQRRRAIDNACQASATRKSATRESTS